MKIPKAAAVLGGEHEGHTVGSGDALLLRFAVEAHIARFPTFHNNGFTAADRAAVLEALQAGTTPGRHALGFSAQGLRALHEALIVFAAMVARGDVSVTGDDDENIADEVGPRLLMLIDTFTTLMGLRGATAAEVVAGVVRLLDAFECAADAAPQGMRA